MSKSSIATAPKIPTQLSTKSAWAKGPPQNTSNATSPRSQSPTPSNAPAPHPTHSRRTSNLGQGVPIKDGVSVPRSNVGAVKQGSAVTFGSIDDVSASISSPPTTSAVSIKSEVLKSFGTVPASVGHANGKSSVSIPSKPSTIASTSTSSSTSASATAPSTPSKTTINKVDIAKLFQNPGSSTAPSPHPSSDTASPSIRPINLPSQTPQHQLQASQHQQGQPHPPNSPSQLGAHPYTPFVPSGGLRPQTQSGPVGGPGSGPRSPVYNRQMTNGNGPRPSGGPNGPGGGPSPMSAGLSSPRLASHPHPGQPSGMPPPPQPVPIPGWPGYYYPPEHYMQSYSPGWYVPPHPLPHQHQPHQHHPPPGQPGPPQHSGMPMSPRHPPPALPQPGTPTQAHAMPNPIHTPQPTVSHSSSNSIAGLSSPPPTPSASGPNGARLNTNASAFVPKKVTIKNSDGTELDLGALKKSPAAPASPGGFNTSTNRKPAIRMESEEARHKRLSEEQERSREKERAKQEAEDKMNREREEKERMEKEEELRRRKEEGEKEKERNRKEEEERERIRKEEREEQDRRRQEAEKERLALEEAERRKKEELEKEEERFRKEEKEKERLLREEAERERIRKEEEATVAAAASAAVDEAAPELDEVEEVDGEVEVEDEVEETATKPKERDLRIDTTTTTSAPLTSESRRRPGPLDLSYASKANVAAPLPSALATARIIDDLGRVPYPEGVRSPQIELNINAKDGKFRYDRDFLLQFMSICKEKPDMLPPLDAIGLEPSDQALSRGGSGRHRQSSTSGGQPQPSARQPPVGLGFNAPSFAKSGAPNPFNMGNMGNFATMGTKLSSEERFAIANNGRSASVGGSAGLPFGRPAAPMVRTTSQGGPGGTPGSMPSNRTRSKRGVPRDNTNKVLGGSGGGSSQQGHGSTSGSSGFSGPLGPGSMLDPVVPLEQSANRWVPTSTSRKPTGIDPDSPEIVDRKVKGLLNKLTMEKFDPISDQIIAWANRSEKEKDGRTLIQVIRLVFEKATDEATWSEMYARLCRKMMEQISSKVQDDGIKNSEGKPIAGGQLFRKYLLNRCQEDFERGWVAKEATAAAAATKAMEDQAAKAANDKSTEDNTGDEVELYSEEYYAAQKAKRQGLGLIKFIGELFKLQMLTERIMHECVKKLLGNVKNPEEEEIESLCKLLSTVGAILDTNKARAHMDVYFSRMKELIKSPNVSSRMQFMLQDVTELRERKWVSRNLVAAPTTIAQIHENAAKEKAAAEKDSYNRQISMSRGGSRRGGDRGDAPDGWAVAGGSGPPRPPPKAGDLSNFGKINKTTAMTFGPSSVFAGKKEVGKRETISRTNSSQNMFSMLSQNAEAAGEGSNPKSSHSRKTSIDISHSGVTEPPPQRKRLILQPRTKPATEETAPVLESESSSEDEVTDRMSESEASKKIDEDSKEFFGVRSLEEAEVYFTNLPAEHHFRLVEKLVSSAVESKESDAQLVSDFFNRAAAKGLCSPTVFEEGFMPVAELLDDIAIDAPKAFNFMAIMMVGAGLDKDEERRMRIASKSDVDRLVALLS